MRGMLASVAALVLLLFGSSGATQGTQGARSASDQETKYEVTVQNFTFIPGSLTVPVGTTVTWINHDEEPHRVVSTEKKFNSPVLQKDAKFTHTFSAPGTYDYYCSIHPKMTGKVIVK